MRNTHSNSLFVFREQSHLFGILDSEFDSYISLDKLWVSPLNNNQPLWKFEGKQSKHQGYFIHPAVLFGFDNIRFSQSGIVFFRKIAGKGLVGLMMNDFHMQLVNGKLGPKVISTNVVKNFPVGLPKAAFHFVKRHKRKNILVINLEELVREYQIEWPA